MKLRTLLTLAFTTITLPPIGALAIWLDRSTFQKEIDAVEEKHLLLADNIGAALSRYSADLTSAFKLARLQRQNESVSSGLLTYLRLRHVRSLFWADPETNAILGRIDPDPRFKPGDVGTILAAVPEGRVVEGVTFTGVLPDGNAEPTIFMVAREEGRPVSIAAVETSYFVELQRSVEFGRRGHAAIVDHRGRLLAHPLEDWRMEMRDITVIEPVVRMMDGETGVLAFFSPARKADMIAGYSVVPGPGWGVMVVQPLFELRERASSERMVVAGIMLVTLIVSTLFSWVFSGYLTRSILPIVEAANANALGSFGVEAAKPTSLAPRELRSLARSFNILAREIKSSHERNGKALESARQAEEEYRGIFDAVAIGIYRIGMDGHLLRANPAMVRLNGFESEDRMLAALGDDTTQWHVDPHRREEFLRLLVEHGEVRNFVSEIHCHRTDRKIWVSEDARAIHDGDGNPLYFEGTMLDITERKKAEEATRRAIEAEAHNKTKSAFLATVSHELRTPLNAIIGFSEIMKRGTMGPIGVPRYGEYVEAIHDSGLHLLDLIDDLLDLSKIEAGKFELHDEMLDLGTLIPRVSQNIALGAAKKRLTLTLELERDLPVLRADRRSTERMLLNLLSNAVKFTPEGGNIAIQAFACEGGIAVSVADDGIGIEEADLEKVMTPFTQAEETLVRTQAGTGLGLPIVRSLIEMHGGAVELRSTLGAGTTVTIRFPAGRAIRQVA